MLVKNTIRVGVALCALASLTVSAFASSVSGIWHGHINFDTTKLPTVTDANQRKAMLAQIKTQEAIKITLTLKTDGNFSMITLGGPKQNAPVTGTYKVKGSNLEIQPMKAGKPGPTRSFTISKDSHTLSFVQGPVTVTFGK